MFHWPFAGTGDLLWLDVPAGSVRWGDALFFVVSLFKDTVTDFLQV